jgi:hypothetical protein
MTPTRDGTGAIVFLASLPPIQSAIAFDGNDGNARLKLDVPATDAEAILMLQRRGTRKLLKVTIEVIES